MELEELNNLVDKARRRDPDALATLCERYYPRLVKYMYYRCSAQSSEDLAGEVILRVMKSIDRQTGRFEPWLYRVARNVIIDKGRYHKARPEVEMTVEQEHELEAKHKTYTGATMDLAVGLTHLSDEHRELLTLRFIQGMSAGEVGDVMNRSAGAIRTMQVRALQALKKFFEGGIR
jgi:RNA polymerase sigma-70 factor (ECF subfamily)